MSNYQELAEIVQELPDSDLLIIWNNLVYYDPKDEYTPGISMDDWAQLIYGELSFRGILQNLMLKEELNND